MSWAEALQQGVQTFKPCLDSPHHNLEAKLLLALLLCQSQQSSELCPPQRFLWSRPWGSWKPASLLRGISRAALITLTESLPALPCSRLKGTQRPALKCRNLGPSPYPLHLVKSILLGKLLNLFNYICKIDAIIKKSLWDQL